MRDAFRLFSIMALGAAFCVPALASNKAQTLQESCQANDRVDAAVAANDSSHLKPTDEVASGFCLGFIMAWAQTIDGMGTLGDNADLTFFYFPDDFNFQQGKTAFLRYVGEHPESLSKQAAFVLRTALSEKNILQKRVLPLGNV